MGEALSALSAALASGNPGAVLAAERPLAEAVRQLPGRGVVLSSRERFRLRALVADAGRALHRCRQLGEAARDLAAAGVIAHHGYGRSGSLVAASPRTTINSRS
jgi:hypothetical protein